MNNSVNNINTNMGFNTSNITQNVNNVGNVLNTNMGMNNIQLNQQMNQNTLQLQQQLFAGSNLNQQYTNQIQQNIF